MRTIKIQIVGRSAETDAPSVDDLLDQLRDYFDILRGVEQAAAADGSEEIDWRVIDASKNSPLALEAGAFARQYAMNVDNRAGIVVWHTANGLRALQVGAVRPPFFDDKVLIKAEHLFERVTNGLAQTIVDHGAGLPIMELDRSKAYAAMANVRQLLKPQPKAYDETGSIEGIAHGFDRDGWNNPVLKVKHRATGEDLTCRLTGQALEEIEKRQVGEIWRNSRVLLYGTIHFKAPGRIHRIDANRIRFLRNSNDLPSLDDVTDPDFTGGLSSEEYLVRLRNGSLS
jgi:hypothetical protein